MNGVIKTLELFDDVKVKVHSDGKIETLEHKAVRKNGRLDNRKGRILKPVVDKYGYENITLSRSGKRKTYLVHRLVAIAFIENVENKPTVNHIDGNKRNNEVANLEWATHKEQKAHALKNGLAKKNVEALKESNRKKSIKVKFRGKIYSSIKSAAKENGVHERVVKRESEVMPNE